MFMKYTQKNTLTRILVAQHKWKIYLFINTFNESLHIKSTLFMFMWHNMVSLEQVIVMLAVHH